MRLLIALIVVAALGWSAYWYWGASTLENRIRTEIEDAEGLSAESVNVTGFPNRFDTMVDQPRLTLNGADITWEAPFLQVFALSYRPNQIIAVLPRDQTVTGPFGEARIATEDARASATLRPERALTLDHSNFVAEGVRIVSDRGEATAARVLAATRLPENDDSGRVQNIGVTLDDLTLPGGMVPNGVPDVIDGATLDATLTMAEPIDRRTLEGAPVSVQRIEIDGLDLDWGEIGANAEGTLDVGADGVLSGEVNATLTNWQGALQIAAQAGLLPEGQMATAEQALGMLSTMSGGGDRLTVPLSFREGQVFLGPVPLGPAPRLR